MRANGRERGEEVPASLFQHNKCVCGLNASWGPFSEAVCVSVCVHYVEQNGQPVSKIFPFPFSHGFEAG